ncbi:MAG: hypothetical protein H6983_02170 [Ectothiorhodospiraceae bacterium]|nr:hypothetical protein [Ectothiorhodospiraceae bacterium]
MDLQIPEISLRDLVEIVFRRLWAMVSIVVMVMLVVTVWVFVIRGNLYETEAKLLVRIGHEQAPPSTVLRPNTPIVGYRFQDVNSEVEILRSTDLIGRVVDELGLDRPSTPEVPSGLVARIRFEIKRLIAEVREWVDEILIRVGLRTRLTDREKAVAMLESGLFVLSSEDSNVITAKLLLPAREGISGVLDKIVALYLDTRLAHFQSPGVVDLFREQSDQALQALRDAERALAALEREVDIVNLATQKELLLERATELDRAIAQARIEVATLRERVDRLDRALAADSPRLGLLGDLGEGLQAELLRRLAEIERERIELEATEIGAALKLRRNREQFRVTAELLASNLGTALAEREAELAAREQARAAVQSRLTDLHEHEARWRDLQREVTILDGEYQFYQGRLHEATATVAMEQARIGNVSIIQHPIDPLAPAGIRKIYLLVIGLVLGIVAALAWATVAEFFDHRTYSREQVRRHLGVDAVAVLPRTSRRRLPATG